jgi:hypothetical protein
MLEFFSFVAAMARLPSLPLLLAAAMLLCVQQVVPASAHVCMFSPPQRGAQNMKLDHPGDNSCAHKGPEVCGGVPAGPVVASYTAGSMVTIAFQQNLNHFFGTIHFFSCCSSREESAVRACRFVFHLHFFPGPALSFPLFPVRRWSRSFGGANFPIRFSIARI